MSYPKDSIFVIFYNHIKNQLKNGYYVFNDMYYDYKNQENKISLTDEERKVIFQPLVEYEEYYPEVCELYMRYLTNESSKTPFSENNKDFKNRNVVLHRGITQCNKYYHTYWNIMLGYIEKYGHEKNCNRKFYKERHEKFIQYLNHFEYYTKDDLKFEDKILDLSNFVKKE